MIHIIAALSGQPLAVMPAYAEALWAYLSGRHDGALAATDNKFAARAPEVIGVPSDITHIAVLGSLTHRGSNMDAVSGMASYREIGGRIDSAIANPAIKGIILEIDSPGGSISGAFDLADKIRAARDRKPIVAFVDGLAASAGYLIASQCTKIVATQTSQIGSIGVVITHVDRSNQLTQQGLKPSFIFAGSQKVDGNSAFPLPEDVRRRMQSDVDRSYEMFLEAVGSGRGEAFSAESARRTEAGVFAAADAVRIGMIDKVGVLADAVRMASATPSSGTAVARSLGSAPIPVFSSPATKTPPREQSAAVKAGLADYEARVQRHLDAVNQARSRNLKPLLTKADLSAAVLQGLMGETIDASFSRSAVGEHDHRVQRYLDAVDTARRMGGRTPLTTADLSQATRDALRSESSGVTRQPMPPIKENVDLDAVATARKIRAARYGS